MRTKYDYDRWEVDHRLVFPTDNEPPASWGDLVEMLILLPLATFVVVEILGRLAW
jgi:hypothetical protein